MTGALDYSLLVPEYFLAFWAALVVAVDLTFPRLRKEHVAYLAAVGMLPAIGLSIALYHDTTDSFGGLIGVDRYTTFFRVFFQVITLFTILASARYVRDRLNHAGEYYGLLVVSTIGATYMAAARELLTAYISLELLSFSLYILASYAKFDPRSNEGGLKYMLLGAFSSAILLYGLSLVYGSSGSTVYAEVAGALAGGADSVRPALLLGLVLIIAGLGFKVSAVPFHTWAPDAYEGAPMPITAYISAASKAAGFALFLRLFAGAFQPVLDDWRWMVAALSAASIMLGNLIALRQSNIKRLLAYSSIGQVGYLLMGIAALSPAAASALLIHLAGYVVTNLVVFLVAIHYYDETGKEEVKDYAGLAQRSPFLALTMTMALFSLAGLPVFAGFLTKFILFQAAAEEGLIWLAAVAATGSMISLYYYLIIIRQMYIEEPAEPGRLKVAPVLYGSVAALAAAMVLIGVYPAPIFEVTDEAARLIFL